MKGDKQVHRLGFVLSPLTFWTDNVVAGGEIGVLSLQSLPSRRWGGHQG